MAYWTETTDPLDDGESYTGPTRLTERHDQVAGSVFSDTDGALYIEQSSDGTNWDISTSYAVTADDGKGFAEDLLLPFWRVRFTNDSGGNATEFRLVAHTIAAGDS